MKRVEKSIPWLALGLAALLALGFGNVALAEDASANETTAKTVEPSAENASSAADGTFVPVTFAGMQVFVDQETGRMRKPTARESRELAMRMRTLFQGKHAAHQPTVDKSGMTSLVVAPNYLNFTVAVVKEDGSVETDCVQDPEEGLARLEQVAVSAPREEQ